jgi:hypothetical protein
MPAPPRALGSKFPFSAIALGSNFSSVIGNHLADSSLQKLHVNIYEIIVDIK